jgi:hypothetical protein
LHKSPVIALLTPIAPPFSGVTQILESSQTLLQVLKRESVNLQKKRQTSN